MVTRGGGVVQACCNRFRVGKIARDLVQFRDLVWRFCPPYKAGDYGGCFSQKPSAADDTPPVMTQGRPSSICPVAAAAMQPTASAPVPICPQSETLRR